jgi:hypothetical protein
MTANDHVEFVLWKNLPIEQEVHSPFTAAWILP